MTESALPVHRFPAAAERLWSGFAAAGNGGAIAILPLFLLRWPVQELQLAFGLTGAMLLPLLALTLLIMNNRTAWVGDRLRASLALNLVLAVALGFFAFTAMREVMRLAG
jgi:hypothetical protein